VQPVQAFECRRIALLGKPDRFRFRYLPSFDSSRSGHATRRDASFNAMRLPLQKLYFPFSPRNCVASVLAAAGNSGQALLMQGTPGKSRLFSTELRPTSSGLPAESVACNLRETQRTGNVGPT